MTEVTPEATTTLEDMFLITFCHIDDLYTILVPEGVPKRRQHRRLAMSDAEIITLSIMHSAESQPKALGFDAEQSFLAFVRKNYLDLFPQLLSRDRYNRRRRDLVEVSLLLFRHLAAFFKARARHLIIDSAPIETAARVRSQSAQRSMPEATYGYLPAKKRHFFGFRLHGLVSDEGAVLDFIVSPANVDERTVARELLQPYTGYSVLSDNGYSGEAMQQAAERGGYRLWSSPRQRERPNSAQEARWRRWLRGKRDLIETVFSMLADQFNFETTRALSLWGLKTRLAAKLLAFNLSLFLNHHLGRDLLAVKSLYF